MAPSPFEDHALTASDSSTCAAKAAPEASAVLPPTMAEVWGMFRSGAATWKVPPRPRQ